MTKRTKTQRAVVVFTIIFGVSVIILAFSLVYALVDWGVSAIILAFSAVTALADWGVREWVLGNPWPMVIMASVLAVTTVSVLYIRGGRDE